MNDNKTKLAVKIIGDQFGDIVQDVAKVLTEGDSCTLLHIVRAVNANITARNTSAALNINNTGLVLKHKTGLAMDFPTVRSALLILHQHNCLVIDKPKSSEFDPVAPVKDMKTGFVYSLNVTNILHRMHFARLLSIVKAKYGELAVQIVECVMMYGKVRLDQIAEQVANMNAEPVSLNAIRSTFESLVSNRFLITVYPSPTGSVTSGTGPVIEIVTKKRLIDLDTPADSGKRTKTAAGSATGSGSASGASTSAAAPVAPATSKRRVATMNFVKQEDDGIPVELRMLMGGGAGASSGTSSGTSTSASAASEVKAPETGARAGAGGRGGAGRGGRGSGADSSATATSTSTGGAGGRGGRGAGRGGAGTFKTEETSLDSTLISSTAASKLWTIGWDQFIRETRHNACVQVVTQLHAAMAGSVVRVILQLSMNAESGSNQNKSGEVSVLEMFKQLEKEGQLAQFPGVNKEDKMKVLRHLLEILRMSESAAVIKVVGSESELGGPSYMVNIDRLIATLQRRTIFTIASERFGFVSARIVELLQRHQYLEQQQVCDMALLPARETRERLYKLFLDKWINYIDLSKRNDFNPSTSFYFWYLDLPLLKSTIRDHVYQTMLNLTLRRAHETEAGRELLDREHLIDNESDRNKHAALMTKLNKLDLAIYKVDSTILLMEHF